MKAVLSVVGQYADDATGSKDHNPLYSYASWQEIKELSDSGVFEIGNHTYDMHKISGVRFGCAKIRGENEYTYNETLTADVMKLQNRFQDELHYAPGIFTFPFGKESPEAFPALKNMGFHVLFTCREKVNRIGKSQEDLYTLGRYNRPHGISTDRFFRNFEKQLNP
ncbi:MAG: hypothetical protein BGN88_04200 [Clostridiales bacterium 43-6]|nr:MAG: hypothetical protein BGN88_04200 [Clostridiales bacterium 43-6]